MSGTSLDAVDVAVVRFPAGAVRSAELLAYCEQPFPPELRRRVRAAMEGGSTAELCLLHSELGALFGSAVAATLAAHPLLPPPLFVASHGQTLFHAPERHATLQLGEAAVILERVPGVSFVVSNFRAADVAAGGQGAPLVPFFDQWAWGGDARPLALANAGGIANVTLLGGGAETLAFDTGPGNVVADALCQALRGLPCDRDGSVSGAGKVLPEVLWAMEALGAPFLAKRDGPRSTGRELFGDAFVRALLSRFGTSERSEDLVATAVEFTAATLWRAVVDSGRRPVVLAVAGGGARNPTLMRRLAELAGPGTQVVAQEQLPQCVAGLTAENKEATAFALLGLATLLGVPGNVPSATGASRAVVLGQVACRAASLLTTPRVHATAQAGFAQNVEAYQRGRPEYPMDLVSGALEEAARDAGRPVAELAVADVGAGSGKLTVALAACGARLVAVEPSAAMRAACARQCPEVPQLEGTAEALPLADESQDVLFFGQAFHWCASLDTLREARRVLRRGGRIALIWNSEEEGVAWAAELRVLLAPLEAAVPHYRSGEWRRVWATAEATAWFEVLPERQVRQAPRVTRQQCWDRVLSKSYVSALEPAAQQRLRAQCEAVLERPFAGLPPEATVECPLETLLFTAVKR